MKKIILLSFILILSTFVHSQDIKSIVSIGPSTFIYSDNPQMKWTPAVIYGLEFKDRFGLEYGYSFHINKSAKDFDNYVNGITNNYEAGRVTRVFTAYYKTKKDEKVGANIGAGIAHTFIAKAVNTDVSLKNELHPFLRIGLDNQVSKLIGVSINMSLGNFFMVTYGLSINLR